MSLFIFRRHSTREPAPVVCYDEQGDLFSSAGQPVFATADTGRTRERFWKNAGEWTGRVEIARKKSLAACMAIY